MYRSAVAHNDVHHELRSRLEEADHCYTLMLEAGGSQNLDRAGYVAPIMHDIFRRLLDRGDLHVDELAATLREVFIHDHQALRFSPTRVPRPVQADIIADDAGPAWGDIIAALAARRANGN